MQFSTRSVLAALLMAGDALAGKRCGKDLHHKHTTLSTSIRPSVRPTPVPVGTSVPVIVVPSIVPSSYAVTTTPSSAAATTPAAATTSSTPAAASTSAAASATPASGLTSDQQKALDVQNAARSGVSETALTWDDSLASDALAWANHLVTLGAGNLVHDTGSGEGENLYWQSDSTDPYTAAANAWVAEKSSYSGEAIGEGNFEAYGHYTQIIWKTTTKVGMAIAADGSGGYFVVARYTPEGNVEGEIPTTAS